jgi:acyl-CoA synthetase (AMP-forming)/AMP-acid ligase II
MDALHSTIEFATLVELLQWRALHQPERRAMTFLVDGEAEEVYLTYGELDRQARAIGALLQRLDAAGARALLLYPPGLEYIAAFFGCLYAGAVTVPCYPPRLNRPDPRLEAVLLDSQAAVALTTTHILADIERRFVHTPALKALQWLATDDLADGLAEEWRGPAIESETLAFLQYTSGSTAAPKGVMLTHGNLLYNSALIHRCFGHTPESRGVIWLPPYHDMGLIGGILQPVYGGFPVVLMSPLAFLQTPLRWLQAVSRYQATTSGGPNFAYDLCVDKIAPEQRAALDLSSWVVAFDGAEPVRPGTLERFAAAFGPCGFRRAAFYPCYGLAEATLIVSGGERTALPVVQRFETAALERERMARVSANQDDSRALVGCGQNLPGQRIVIADPETSVLCSPDRIGEIWLAGPSVAQGYWRRPDETQRTFGACLADSGQGPFLRTGDLGFLKNGELFIAGRLKDLIIVRGRNHYPQDVELTVERSHPALQPACGAAFPVDVDGEERLVIVQELKRTHRKADVEQVAQAIRQAVAGAHELQVYAVVLVSPMSIPKTSSGKIQRYVCRAQFLEGGLKIIGSNILDASAAEAPSGQSEESFIRKALAAVKEPGAQRALLTLYLQEQVARELGIEPSRLHPQQPLSKVGLDPLKAVGLQYSIEKDLGVVLSAASFLEGPSVSQLASQVLSEMSLNSPTPLKL